MEYSYGRIIIARVISRKIVFKRTLVLIIERLKKSMYTHTHARARIRRWRNIARKVSNSGFDLDEI